LERYACGYSLAWKQCKLGAAGAARLGPLPQWTERQISAHASGTAFELFHALQQASPQLGPDSPDFTSQVVNAMFPPTRFAAVLQDLKDDPEPGPGVVEGLKRLLATEQGDAFVRPIHESFDALPEAVREPAIGLLARHAAGHEAVIGHLLTVAAPAHAHTLIRALRDLGSPQALSAVCFALSSPHLEVRMEGLASLPEAPSDRVRADVERLVNDADPAMRQEVLRTVAERKVLAAGPTLTRRIQDDKFLELPSEERRLLLEAVGALNRRRADDLAIEWLDRQQVFRTDALEQTRAMAAEFLAGSESTEALDALQRAAKKRLFSSQAVRDTAQRGADAVQSRRSSLPPGRRGS
jgi:HEAT repeat protein